MGRYACAFLSVVVLMLAHVLLLMPLAGYLYGRLRDTDTEPGCAALVSLAAALYINHVLAIASGRCCYYYWYSKACPADVTLRIVPCFVRFNLTSFFLF